MIFESSTEAPTDIVHALNTEHDTSNKTQEQSTAHAEIEPVDTNEMTKQTKVESLRSL